jgi:hypothetical protein
VKVLSGHQNDLSDFQKLEAEGVNISYDAISNTGFCLGSASVPRELILSTQVNASLDGEDVSTSCNNTSLGDEKLALDIKNCGTHSHDIV